MAAVDYFLKIDSVDGESTDDKHKGEIDLESWSWGETNSGTGGHVGKGSGAGKVSMQDFHFTAKVNKSSPKLFLACATGQHFPKAVLTCRKAGGDQQEFLKITMTEVFVSSYQVGGSGGSDIVPVEQVSLNYSKIEKEYKPQKADGSLDSPVKAGWDLSKNVKV